MLSLTVAFITKKAVPSLTQYRNSQTSPQYIHYLVKNHIDRFELLTGVEACKCL